jgi:hypothetical protein
VVFYKTTETNYLITMKLLMLIFCFRAWLGCKEMQDVEVKLPSGLALSVSIHMQSCILWCRFFILNLFICLALCRKVVSEREGTKLPHEGW